MRRHLASLIGLGAVLSATMLWLISAPSAAAGDPCYHGFTLPDDTAMASTTVTLEPCAFAPTIASVPVGAKVTFQNPTQFTHLITGANQTWGSRDTEVAPGASVSYSFDKAGLYAYACALHRGMSGVVMVGDAAGITAAAVGSTSGTTTGATGGSGGGGTTTTAAAPAQTAPQTIDPLPLVALAAAVGVVIGAAGAWLLTRRRTTPDETVAATAS
jgi:plastocyanin